MKNDDVLKEALYSHFLARLRRPSTKKVGIELELPVWNLRGGATDFEAVHAAVAGFLGAFSFPDTSRDDAGALYRARDPVTGDELSFDCSFNTLELSFGPEEDIGIVEERFRRYYPALQAALARGGHSLTGMGINPRWRDNRIAPIANGRYRMLLHHLKSYSKYGGAPYSLTPSPDDVAWLRPFKFEDLTQRGTVEFRSVCAQPVRDAFAPAAFHAGLAENLTRLEVFLGGDRSIYGHGYGAAEMRAILVRRDWPSFVDGKYLAKRLDRLLDIAEEGLERRGFGEARLLKPLRERAAALSNPAREHLERLDRGEGIASIAEDYGSL